MPPNSDSTHERAAEISETRWWRKQLGQFPMAQTGYIGGLGWGLFGSYELARYGIKDKADLEFTAASCALVGGLLLCEAVIQSLVPELPNLLPAGLAVFASLWLAIHLSAGHPDLVLSTSIALAVLLGAAVLYPAIEGLVPRATARLEAAEAFATRILVALGAVILAFGFVCEFRVHELDAAKTKSVPTSATQRSAGLQPSLLRMRAAR